MKEFLKPFGNDCATAPLYISLAGKTYPDPTYLIKRPASPVAVIEYVTGGLGYVMSERAWQRVGADTIYFLKEGQDHEYFADKEHPYTKIFLNVSGPLCDRLISAYGLADKRFFEGGGLKGLFERILSVIRSGAPDHEMQSALQGIFVEILSRLSFADAATEHSEEAIRLKNYLDANVRRTVSAEELSGVIFRSPDYCQKLFKREFGSTPHAYQTSRKMENARALLGETNLSVGQICELLGYSDAHYFSNVFKQKCGCRPVEFRKRRR